MTRNKTQIQFHRRSRYEDILELVNDNEEALKPFPNRDAEFYKASNKGSYFDGKDHLDRLKAEQKRINERLVRDHMLREYATDNDLTHRALWNAGAGATDTPARPEMYNIGTPIEEYGNDDFFDTDEDTSFTRAQLEGVIQRAEKTSGGTSMRTLIIGATRLAGICPAKALNSSRIISRRPCCS